jgi:excisionase family DNA binding protein
VTTQQAAERLGTTRRVVQRWIQQGRLTAEKNGRDWYVTEANVAAFNAARTRKIRTDAGTTREDGEDEERVKRNQNRATGVREC